MAVFVCSLWLAGCTVIRTENDTTPPTLTAWLYNVESDPVIFRSTDADTEVTNNCPTNNGYFADLDDSTLEVGILASDPGGVDNMSIEVSPVRVSDIRNVVAVNNPALTPTLTQTAPLKVTISAEFSNRLTGQMIKFDVMGIDSVMLIDAAAVDLLLHRAAFVDPDAGTFYPARVLHSDLCGN
ncbi:hypothetical protein CGL56_05430 [Neolewinella marina]|uniref:Uncharacterized protein n=1 Tax=Neolewinella marina TaxID=438751 RepID=A0A2G0CKH5_9BACT|nr:hypothetical protein CGL56_05430 [Neolewinella marina]